MAERAGKTLGVFRRLTEEFEGLGLIPVVKLAYEVDGGPPDDREHLWFQVHGFTEGAVDATLGNDPHRVAALKSGQRGEHSLERLSDWTILSPEGPITPRNVSAARRLRERRAFWEEVKAKTAGGSSDR